MSPPAPTPRSATLDVHLRRARDGEPSGFDALYRTLAGRIVAFSRSRGAVDPEGICNEAFLRAFRGLGDFEGDSAAFTRWLFAITRNLLIDAHRHRERRPDEVFAEPPDATQPGADEEALARMGGAEMTALLDLLTDDQREVIVLRLVSDLSLQDTADIVGKPVTAVKRLQARALRTLQAAVLDDRDGVQRAAPEKVREISDPRSPTPHE